MVDVGPGLFTGLRVGVATAQGLAQGLGIGVLAVSSLEVLAAQAAGRGLARCGAGGGRRAGAARCFTAAYEGGGAVPDELLPPALRRPVDLAAVRLRGARRGQVRRRRWRSATARGATPASCARPRVVVAPPGLRAGRRRRPWWRSGLPACAGAPSPCRPRPLAPLYLRHPTPRINWVQREPARARSRDPGTRARAGADAPPGHEVGPRHRGARLPRAVVARRSSPRSSPSATAAPTRWPRTAGGWSATAASCSWARRRTSPRIAVAPEYQGHGVATVLLLDAVHTALDEGARHLSLEVATGNERRPGPLPALRLRAGRRTQALLPGDRRGRLCDVGLRPQLAGLRGAPGRHRPSGWLRRP